MPAVSAPAFPPTPASTINSAQTPQLTSTPETRPTNSERTVGSVGADEPKKTIRKVEAEFFTFEVTQCKSSGTAIACDMKITNNDKERGLRVDGGQLYDNSGYKYNLSSWRIANLENSGATIKLFKDEPVEARVEFNKVSPQAANRIIALELSFSATSGNKGTSIDVQFRNLPLTQDSSSQ